MISERLAKVIRDELHLDSIALEDTTKASEVPGWDSLSHISILTAVEKEYQIRFRGLEVIHLKNVGDLQRLINKKTGI